MKYLLLISLVISSCSTPKINQQSSIAQSNIAESGIAESTNKRSSHYSVKKINFDKPRNWANAYYEKTYFIVKNPVILEDYNELVEICKSKDFDFKVDYQSTQAAGIMYKEMPINIKTNSGFSKVVYISKGACREFSLFKSKKLNPAKQIRKSISKMTLIYVYNQGTYLKNTVFSTPFKGVNFLVE